VQKDKDESFKLSIFKGREAKLNRAIINVFESEEKKSTRQIYKKIIQNKELKNTNYSTVNKRIRNLEKTGFLKKTLTQKRSGGITNYYQLQTKSLLAKFLDDHNAKDLFENISDESAIEILNVLIKTTKPNKNRES
jgi:predicted transcriptional regulator